MSGSRRLRGHAPGRGDDRALGQRSRITPPPSGAGDTPPTDLRLVPAALTAWLGMWLATSGMWMLILAGAVGGGVGLVVARWRRSWPIAVAAIVLLLCVATGGLRGWLAEQDRLTTLAAERAIVVAVVEVRGTAQGGPRQGVRPAWWRSAAIVREVEGRGRYLAGGAQIELTASGDNVEAWRSVAPGTTVRATIRLAPGESGGSPVITARAREPPRIVEPPGLADQAVERVRAALRDAVAILPEAPRGLVPGLAVGDTSAMPPALTEQFTLTGLTHLTAVSGSNLALVLAFLSLLARRIGVRGWWLRGLLVVGVVAFVALCRAEPSVVRAAAMGLVSLAALGSSAPGRSGVRPLAAAVLIVLLVDPGMSRSWGFALSVAATAGIVLWSAGWSAKLGRWLPTFLAESVAVSLAAQLATQPLITALSGRVSLVGLAANMAAAPLVGPTTVLGLVAAPMFLVWSPLGIGLGWMAGGFAQGLCWIAEAGAQLPGASFTLPTTAAAVALVSVCALALALGLGRLLARPLVVGLALVLLGVALIRPPTRPGWPPADWSVVFCDVGQGDATVLRAGPSAAVLVDVGPDPRFVARCLRDLGVTTVVGIVLTHFHADHIGGLSGAVGGTEVDTLVTSGAQSPDYGVRTVAGQSGIQHRVVANPGTVFEAGQVRITFVSIRPTSLTSGIDEGESAAENDGSLVMRAEVRGLEVLLGGDVQEDGQSWAIAHGADLVADVLLVPHHGSAHQDPDFLAQSRARLVVLSVGAHNSYGHPSATALRLVRPLGAPIVRTDQAGSIAVAKASDGRLLVTTER